MILKPQSGLWRSPVGLDDLPFVSLPLPHDGLGSEAVLDSDSPPLEQRHPVLHSGIILVLGGSVDQKALKLDITTRGVGVTKFGPSY
jgi:hypothetical protein